MGTTETAVIHDATLISDRCIMRKYHRLLKFYTIVFTYTLIVLKIKTAQLQKEHTILS